LICLFSCKIAFGNGKQENKIIIPNEFIDFHLVLNKRLPADVLVKLRRLDSVYGYGYQINDDEKLFDAVDLFHERGTIKWIELKGYFYLKDENENIIFYKPDRILEICNNLYGGTDLLYNESVNLSKGLVVDKYRRKIWILKNVTVSFLYLPKEDLDEIRNSNAQMVYYELIYSGPVIGKPHLPPNDIITPIPPRGSIPVVLPSESG
jgi:hypothetical protein